jgi:hypothetical protein
MHLLLQIPQPTTYGSATIPLNSHMPQVVDWLVVSPHVVYSPAYHVPNHPHACSQDPLQMTGYAAPDSAAVEEVQVGYTSNCHYR